MATLLRGSVSHTMASAKNIRLEPISHRDAKAFVCAVHYSGKVMQCSQLHFGVFLGGKLHGVLQYGVPIDKRRMIGLVEGTKWSGFFELNRMVFDDKLPRNSESRALSVSFRLIRKHYPHIKWVVSFADACQCGDGVIYRAAGFDLIAVKKNTTMLLMPDGSYCAKKTLDNHPVLNAAYWVKLGAVPLSGFMVKYIYFLDRSYRDKLTVPILPYTAIQEAGASMYKGKRLKQATDVSNIPATGQNRSNRSKAAA